MVLRGGGAEETKKGTSRKTKGSYMICLDTTFIEPKSCSPLFGYVIICLSFTYYINPKGQIYPPNRGREDSHLTI